MADIRELRHANAAARNTEGYGFDRIVRDAEGRNLHVANLKWKTRGDRNNSRSVQLVFFRLDGADGSPCQVGFDGKFLDERLQTGGMIIVFMRDKHRIDSVRIFANRREARGKIFAAQSSVDEKTHCPSLDECRIPPASTSK